MTAGLADPPLVCTGTVQEERFSIGLSEASRDLACWSSRCKGVLSSNIITLLNFGMDLKAFWLLMKRPLRLSLRKLNRVGHGKRRDFFRSLLQLMSFTSILQTVETSRLMLSSEILSAMLRAMAFFPRLFLCVTSEATELRKFNAPTLCLVSGLLRPWIKYEIDPRISAEDSKRVSFAFCSASCFSNFMSLSDNEDIISRMLVEFPLNSPSGSIIFLLL